ncbi:MAG: hypothetical protein IJA61_02420 [Clostridia bacterium]|nr:hypothetical protein [Clostridia bacterium]
MDNNLDYTKAFVIKKKNLIKPVFIFVIILIIVVSSIFLLINFLPNSTKFDVTIPSKDFYAVSLMSSTQKLELDKEYNRVISLGACGYIIKIGDMYNMLALIYPSEDLARSVVASNSHINWDLQVVKISTKDNSFDLDGYGREDIAKVNEIATYIYDFANILYELTISLQTSSISSIACASSINTHKGELLSYKTQLQYFISQTNNKDLIALQEVIIKLDNILEKLVNNLIVNSVDSHIIKYALCEYIDALYNY